MKRLMQQTSRFASKGARMSAMMRQYQPTSMGRKMAAMRAFEGKNQATRNYWTGRQNAKSEMKYQLSVLETQQRRHYNRSQKTTIQPGMELWKPMAAAAAAIIGFYGLNELFNKQKVGTRVEKDTLMSASISQFQRKILVGTYGYMMAGLGVTALAALGSIRTGVAHRYFSMGAVPQWLIGMGGLIGLGMLTRSIGPDNIALKHLSWLGFTSFMGLLLAPVLMYGPTILMRAALYTTGVFGAMSAIALNAEQEKFLYLGGALYTGLIVLILTSFSSLLLPARFVRTQGVMQNLLTYGGLALFTAFLLYDTQKILAAGRSLEGHVKSGAVRKLQSSEYQSTYINLSMKLYMDVINIFISFVQMQGNRRR